MADLLLTAKLRALAGVRAALPDGDVLADELAVALTRAGHDPADAKALDHLRDVDDALGTIRVTRDVLALQATDAADQLVGWLGGILDAHDVAVSGPVDYLGADPGTCAPAATPDASQPPLFDDGRLQAELDQLRADLQARTVERDQARDDTAHANASVERVLSERDQLRAQVETLTGERDQARAATEAAEQAAATDRAGLQAERDALTDALAEARDHIAALQAQVDGRARIQAADDLTARMDDLVAAVTALAD